MGPLSLSLSNTYKIMCKRAHSKGRPVAAQLTCPHLPSLALTSPHLPLTAGQRLASTCKACILRNGFSRRVRRRSWRANGSCNCMAWHGCTYARPSAQKPIILVATIIHIYLIFLSSYPANSIQTGDVQPHRYRNPVILVARPHFSNRRCS